MNDTDTMRVDGVELTVRPITIGDVERLARLFTRLSPSSVHFRFFSPISRPPRAALLRLADVDHRRRDALVAMDGDEIGAVARYDGRPDAGLKASHQAEIAITVEDAWQHQGVGQRLALRLATLATDDLPSMFEQVIKLVKNTGTTFASTELVFRSFPDDVVLEAEDDDDEEDDEDADRNGRDGGDDEDEDEDERGSDAGGPGRR